MEDPREKEKLIKKKNRLEKEHKSNPSKQLANVVRDLGDWYFGSGEMEAALKEYTQLLDICEKLNDKLETAIAHRMIGEIHMNLGNYEESLAHQMNYVNGVRESKSLVEKQRAYATLGRTLLCLSETYEDSSSKKEETSNEAKKAFTKSLKICSELEGTIPQIEIVVMRARLMLNIGLVLEIQKDVEKAINLIFKAVELCNQHKLHQELHRAYLALGAVYERQDEFHQALDIYTKASEVSVDEELKVTARINQIELLIKMGYFEEARKNLIQLYVKKCKRKELYNTISKLLKIIVIIEKNEDHLVVETNNTERLKLYENLGDAAVAVNCYTKAVEYYKGMLTCAENDPINLADKFSAALISLAQTLKDIKKYEEALPYAQRELELCSDYREKCRSAMFLAGLKANIQSISTEDVEKTYELALSNAITSGDLKLQITVMKEMQEYYFDSDIMDKVNEMKRKIEEIQIDNDFDESSVGECSDNEIGGDIDLDELSDVEMELRKMENESNNKSKGTRRSVKKSFVMKRNDKGETLLHVACIQNNITEVENLIKAGHSVNVRDNCGWTPLHEAANHGHYEVVQLLIKAGANINDPGGVECDNITPLHDAASNGHHSIIHLLIKNNADIELKTKNGKTVLDCLQEWRSRTEKSRKSGEILWTDEDEREYQCTYERLKKVLPLKISKSVSMVDLNDADGNKSNNEDEDDSSEDEESNSSISSRLNRSKRRRVEEKISASEFYKRAINDVRKGSKAFKKFSITSDTTKSNKAPLIDAEEMLTDNWLEDDLGIFTTDVHNKHQQEDINESGFVKSKRRSLPSNSNPTTPENERNSKRLKRSSTEGNNTSPIFFNNENSDDLMNFDCTNVNNQQESIKKRLTFKKNLRQTSLLKDSGFSRDRSSSSYNSNKSSSSIFKMSNSNLNKDFWHFKIDVNNKTLIVKLKSGEESFYLLSNLMNEVSVDLIRNTGCKATIIFTTKSGDVLTTDNILNIIYKSVYSDENDYILLSTEFIDLEIPSISERYRSICISNHKECKENGKLMKALKSCQHTEKFSLKGDEETFEINLLLKAIEYEQNLKILNLSNTNFFNCGEIINQTLKELNQLQELHLEGCDIDYKTINCIDSLPSKLRVLNLSYNPFGVESELKLIELILPLRCLEILNLKCCELQSISFKSVLDNISISPMINTIDISWNKIDDENVNNDCIKNIVEQRLFNLNLSYTGQSMLIQKSINSNPLSFMTIETIELSGCNLNNFDVFTLIERCQNLNRIIISNNPKLSKSSLEALLERKPTLNFIDMVGCEKIIERPKDNLFINDPNVCTAKTNMEISVSIYWKDLWLGNSFKYELPFGTIVFTSTL